MKSSRSPSALLNSSVFDLDAASSLSLQDQIRRKIVEGVVVGALAPGQRLPSSRALARHLGVARNTVALAYQKLIADGHLAARERSGIFVAEGMARNIENVRVSGRDTAEASVLWRGRIDAAAVAGAAHLTPPDWQRYPFPFVEGRFDRSLFPVAEWRDASRLTLAVRDISEWASDAGDADDPMLTEQVRTKVLPRRGIHARPDHILITSGAQQALHLTVELLVAPGDTIAMEEPGHPELRQLLERRGARIIHQPVDEEGIIVDARLDEARVIFVSPGHQRPTGVTMSRDRRRALLAVAVASDAIVVEDDFECEANYIELSPPALRGGDDVGRVIYVATLAQTLAPGLRLGLLIGPPEVIRAARGLRRLTTRHPPLSIQRTAAHLLAMGHYDVIMMRLGRVLQERLMALRDALNHYLPHLVAIAPVRGGTAYWVRGPEGMDVDILTRTAEAHGVLIEPVGRYYAADAPPNAFRLGVTSIPTERVRDGVAALAQAIRTVEGVDSGSTEAEVVGALTSRALTAAMSGATLLGKTVYGDPCTIEISTDGSMSGRAGFANEDVDEGEWWVEGEFWCRRWRDWAYGETLRLRTVIEGDRIRWFNADWRLVDSMVIVRAAGRP